MRVRLFTSAFHNSHGSGGLGRMPLWMDAVLLHQLKALIHDNTP